MNDSFVMFISFWEAARELPAKERLKFYDALCEYAFTGEVPDFHGSSRSAFVMAKPIIDSNQRKRTAGKAGGNASGESRKAQADANEQRSKREANVKQTRSKHEANGNEPRTNKSLDSESDSESDVDVDKDVDVDGDKDVDRDVDLTTPPKSPSRRGSERFVPPTVDEVADYVAEKGYDVDPETFVDFYESKGWVVGKTKMKDWRAAVRTWAKNRDKPKQTARSGTTGNAYIDAIQNRMKVVEDWLG